MRIGDALARLLFKREVRLLETIAFTIEALDRRLARIETETEKILCLQPTAENLLRSLDRARRASKGRHPMFTEDSER